MMWHHLSLSKNAKAYYKYLKLTKRFNGHFYIINKRLYHADTLNISTVQFNSTVKYKEI